MLSELIENGYASRTVSLPRGRQRLHVMPTSTGYELQTSPTYIWDGRARGQTPFTVLQHTISGTGTLRYEKRLVKIARGETLLLVIPHNHRYWLEAGDQWEFFWISMQGREALRIHEMILNMHGPVLRLKSATVDRLAACSLRLIQGDGEMPGRASAIAYEAAMALFDDTFGPSLPPGSDNAIGRVMQYVSIHLGEPMAVEDLARVAGLSRAHFSRKFAEQAGLSPAEYILQERMRRAVKLMIANRDMSLKEIAARSGIADNNYFSKVFRRVYGISPTDFRTTGMYATHPSGMGSG